MKYLAGTEQGTGEFANDKFPERAAAELRAAAAVLAGMGLEDVF